MATQIDAATLKAVEELLRDYLEGFGFDKVDVSAGYDHDGDEVIFIDAHYRLSKRPVDSQVMIEVHRKLRHKLAKLGEQRFPHIRHHFDDRQKVVGHR